MKENSDPRIELILDHIMQLAASNLDHRTPQSDRGDVLDAIICGLNMLGEELESTLVSRDAMLRERDRAERANRAKTGFLANMSHELRTPLAAIDGFNQVLMEKGAEFGMPEEFVKFQKYIGINSKLLQSLINDMLDVSRIESGNIEIVEESFDIGELVDGIYHSYRYKAAEMDLTFDCRLAPDLPARMRTDRVKLAQILINLVSNAIKFTPPGGRIELQVGGTAETIEFRMLDQGVGIPADRHGDIFERFTRLDNAATCGPSGTGLGLHITRTLVAALGGDVTVNSATGEGSCFIVRVPNKGADEPAAAPREPAETPCFSPGSRILVVEDNPVNQELLQFILEDLGIAIELADNGKVGIDKAQLMIRQDRRPDIILMDLNMPVMGGMEALEIIRATPDLRQVPVVVLTANALEEQKRAAEETGIADYLVKPIEFDRLVAVLERFLPLATGNANL